MENKYAEIIIKLEEGWSSKPYYCSEHYVTVGFGRKLSDIKNDKLPDITVQQKDELKFLRERIFEIINRLVAHKPVAWNNCNAQRQAILISLCYQLGVAGALKFNKMWLALERNDFELASKEMLDSLWARQTRNRALRHAKTMKDGSLDMYYLSKGELK